MAGLPHLLVQNSCTSYLEAACEKTSNQYHGNRAHDTYVHAKPSLILPDHMTPPLMYMLIQHSSAFTTPLPCISNRGLHQFTCTYSYNCWQHSNCIHIFCQTCSSNYRQVYRDTTWFLGPHTCDLVQSWQKKYPYHTYTYQMCTKSDMHMYNIAKYNM